jgi:hypothetical protein
VSRDEVRCILFQGGARIMPKMDPGDHLDHF